MQVKFLHTLYILCLVAFASSSIMAQSFASQPIDTLEGTFHWEFSAAASSDLVDGVIGLGPVESTGFGDMNLLIRFAANGNIDVRNGGSYEALSPLSYRANQLYYFSVDADVAAQTYSVTAQVPGEEAVVLATDYAFRADNYTGFLAHLSQAQVDAEEGVYLGTSHVQIGDFSDGNFNQVIPTINDTFGVKFSAIPLLANVNTVIGLGGQPIVGYGDFNILIRFNDQGRIDVRNDGAYVAENEVLYGSGDEFGFYVYGNVSDTTYSVIAVAKDGTETTLASNYKFRVNNFNGTLTHFAIKRGIGPVGVKGLMLGEFGIDGPAYSVSEAIEAPLDIFEASYILSPSQDSMDGAFTLGPVASAAWGDYNMLVRFNGNSLIDVRNGGGYEALIDYPYQGGRSYLFRLEADQTTRTYSVFVRDETMAAEDTLALNYAFRDQVQGAIAFRSTKDVDGFLSVDNLGFAMPTLSVRPNTAPNVTAQTDSITLIIQDPAEVVIFQNINDGDLGNQELTITLDNSDPSIASASLSELMNGNLEVTIDGLAEGVTTLTLSIMDDGGTENEGEDITEVALVVTVMPQGRFRTFEVTTADGNLGADARILTGLDDLQNNFGWLGFNTGSGGFTGDNGPAFGAPSGVPRFIYAFYMRFDLGELPFDGEALSATLRVNGEMKTPESAFQEEFVLFAVPDGYPGSDDDGRGAIGELGETEWTEGDCAGCAALNEMGEYLPGKENNIVADNAPGFNEMDDINTATEDWNIFRTNVLTEVGTFELENGSSVLTMTNDIMTELVAEDLNGTVTFILGIRRSTGPDFNAWPVYTSESFGLEPELSIDWDFMTSTRNLVDAANIKVFPNPTFDRLFISDLTDIATLHVTSLTGQRLRTIDATALSTVNGEVDLSKLPAGMYYLDFINRSDVKVQISKFVKQ